MISVIFLTLVIRFGDSIIRQFGNVELLGNQVPTSHRRALANQHIAELAHQTAIATLIPRCD